MKLKLITFFILLSFALQAQQDYYSYITDRRFWSPDMLYGYSFKPQVKETLDGEKQRLKAGSYSFTYSGNYLYVKGGSIEGVYSVNNVMPSDYGYKMNLMNARDPSIQGHLKLILNDIAQVEALVLKRSRKEQEIIFHLPVLSSELKKKEIKYFTDLGDFEVESTDSLWAKQLNPFLVEHEDVQYRFQMKDSTYLKFVETYKVIDKRKPIKAPKVKPAKKKKKKGKKGKGDVEEEIEEEVEEEIEDEDMDVEQQDTIPDLVDLTGMSKEELEEYAETDPKVKLEKAYFIILNTFEDQADGTRKLVEDKYQIKKIDERVDDRAGKGEEKYQIDFTVDGNKHIFMFLLDDRTVSSIEMGYDKFYMRGH